MMVLVVEFGCITSNDKHCNEGIFRTSTSSNELILESHVIKYVF